MTETHPTIAIIGGGISGLSVAYRLQQKLPKSRLILIEKNQRLGGNIATIEKDGFRIECGPNGFLDAKPSTMDLCRDLGLKDRLVAASEGSRKNRYLFLNGKMLALPGSLWSFVKSPVMSWQGKINLLLEKYRHRPADAPEDESIAMFASRRAGKEVASIIADAMVTGIQAGDPELLSLPACFPKVAQFEKEFGSVMRGFSDASRKKRADAKLRGENPQPQRMWSFREGLQVMIDSLRDHLTDSTILGAGVKRILANSDGKWRIEAEGLDHWMADAIVLTSPSWDQAEILADLDRDLANDIAAIPYTPVSVVVFGYRQSDLPDRDLDGFGFIAPQRTRRDLLGVQWCSSIFRDRAPAGMALWRVLCGGWNRPEIINWSDDQLIKSVRDELRVTMGVENAPVMSHIVRWLKAIPQYHVGHLERVARIDKRMSKFEGLFLGGNSYRGIAINDCTEQAVILASRVSEYLARKCGATN